MRKQTKISLIIATCLVLVGAVMFSVAMSAFNWDFEKFGTRIFVTNTYSLSADAFADIAIEAGEADVYFRYSDDDECKIVCYEVENLLHTVEVVNGKLIIRRNDTRELIDFLSFGGGNPEITVYLPKREYNSLLVRRATGDTTIPADFWFGNIDIIQSTGDVICNASATDRITIRTSTGDITIEDIYAKFLSVTVSTGEVNLNTVTCQGNANVKVSTGKAFISNLSCENFDSEGNTGDLTLTDVIATKNIDLERTTGDIFFNSCDAAELRIRTSTGDITGTLLKDKPIFGMDERSDEWWDSYELNTQYVGNVCAYSTNTGEVDIKIKE